MAAGRRRFVWQNLLVLVLLVGAVSCGRREPPPPSQAPAPPAVSLTSSATPKFGDASAPGYQSATPGYVADQRCADCHRDLYDSYQQVGMAQSFYTPDEATLIEDFENNHYYHEPSDRHYEMILRDGDIYQRRYQLDEHGHRIHELEVKVDFIVGSGNHVRAYLYRTPSNELWQMPLAWYSGSQSWRLNPGYDKPEHFGFKRRITRHCMFCHNAYPEVPLGSDEHWQPHLFPEQLPHGIGCQRCHGPGAQHITAANAPSATPEDVVASIINPARLEPQLRNDVCYQCHLQPSSRFVSQLLRFGRAEYSYRPGQSLAEYRVNMDFPEEPGGGEKFEINHHPYRLHRSLCYTQSSGQLSCLTCHDPHRKVPPAQRIAHYRAACLTCHQVEQCETAAMQEHPTAPAGSAPHATAVLADCAACHMPRRRTEDVIHAVMTDHKIVAQPAPETDRLAMLSEHDPDLRHSIPFPYGDQYDASNPEIAMCLSIAGANAGNAKQHQRLVELLQRTPTTQLEPWAELATFLIEQGEHYAALGPLSKIVEHYPQHGRAHLETAMALDGIGQWQQAAPYYQRAIELGPPMPNAYLGLGNALLRAGQFSGAEQLYREAIRLRPMFAEALLNLGILLHNQQRWEESARALRQALAVDPSFVEAYQYLESMPSDRGP